MKKIIVCSVCIVLGVLCLLGCNFTDDNGKKSDKEICTIVESTDIVCTEPMVAGVYAEQNQWEKACQNTDVQTVLDMEKVYNEAFFEQYSLCYIADVFSGNAMYEYEDYTVVEEDGKKILVISYSYSVENLLDTQHSYHFFLTLDREEASQIDEIRLQDICKDYK